MKSRTTYWSVTHSERDPNTGLDAYIPTKGNPTSASDMYRILGYAETGHEGWNSCFTDVNTCNSLAKIIEGEITTWHDVRAAETALQMLMWHDRVDILIPGFKHTTNGIKSYVRCDESRSQLSFDLFKSIQPYDQIYAIESVVSESGIITTSNYSDSNIIGKSIEDIQNNYLSETKLQASALSSIALDFGVPAYFTNPILESNFDKSGYFFKLYKTLNTEWTENDFIPPSIEFDIHLPPLLSIVLTRASSRDSIPEAIESLREELNPIRIELLDFNNMITGSYNQVELENKCKIITQSFEAIFSASRYQGSTVIYPLLKLYKTMKKPLDELMKKFNPNFVPEDPRTVANRTLTGKMLSNLLITDSMHSLVSHYFTKAEIRNLEVDAKKHSYS